MLEYKEGVLLGPYTTFKIGGPAKYFVEVASHEELNESLSFAKGNNLEVFILGGGSNLLISDKGFDGLVIRPLIKGREVLSEDDELVSINVGAGEVLDEVIEWTVQNSWWGMENLSFVPGLVGALVIQNVNAYGAKAEHIVERVDAVDMTSGELVTFTNKQCGFTYRHSIFNTSHKNRYIIINVNLKLAKGGEPNLSYVDLENYFKDKPRPTQSDLRQAVIEIRTSKGQDIERVWSAGSFFSNFLLSEAEFTKLKSKVKNIYGEDKANDLQSIGDKFRDKAEGGNIKIPSAWILDKLLKLKGLGVGDAMHSNQQVLNIINNNKASASDVMELFRQTRRKVYDIFGLELINEPELVGFSKEELGHYFALF